MYSKSEFERASEKKSFIGIKLLLFLVLFGGLVVAGARTYWLETHTLAYPVFDRDSYVYRASDNRVGHVRDVELEIVETPPYWVYEVYFPGIGEAGSYYKAEELIPGGQDAQNEFQRLVEEVMEKNRAESEQKLKQWQEDGGIQVQPNTGE